MDILDLGAGKDRIPNAIRLDSSALANPDVLHDLNNYPYPFDDNSFDLIYCKDVIEHVREIVPTMEEIHRIGRNGATLHITTPHYSCSNSFTDPTHLHHLGIFSFDYFCNANQWDFYTAVKFEKVKATMVFDLNLKNKVIHRIANRYPIFYERHLAWIFPAWFMIFELKVVK